MAVAYLSLTTTVRCVTCRKMIFSGPMKLLSVTDGQRYRVTQSPSTGAAGSGEFRAPNEPYGAMITLMLSGSDLPRPDTVSRASSEGGRVDGNFIATVNVGNVDDEIIRTFSADVHQGINRIVWDMRHDNFRLYPSETQPKALPGPAPHPSVYALPGNYGFTRFIRGSGNTGFTERTCGPALRNL